MNILTNYIRFIVIIKFVFVYFAITALITKFQIKKNPSNKHQLEKQYNDKIYIKERLEIIFKFCMSVLLIYVFFPQRKVPIPIDFEMRLLFYLFGFILLLTAKWKNIIHDNAIDKYLSTLHKVAT